MLSNASASALPCAMCHCTGHQMSSRDQVLVASCLPGDEFMTLTDMHDAPSALSSPASSSDGDWNNVASYVTPTFGEMQLKVGFVRLYQLIASLVVQVTVIASEVISLKDRITAVESTVHTQETEVRARQVNELRESIASQEGRIAGLEYSLRAETESYKKTIQELTTKLDNMKVDDDKKTRDDAIENFRQSFKNFRQSMECQAARITGVKADTARKIALLQSELAGVQADLVTVKTGASPVNAPSACQAVKEAQTSRVLASVSQGIEDAGMAEGSEISPRSPAVC